MWFERMGGFDGIGGLFLTGLQDFTGFILDGMADKEMGSDSLI